MHVEQESSLVPNCQRAKSPAESFVEVRLSEVPLGVPELKDCCVGEALAALKLLNEVYKLGWYRDFSPLFFRKQGAFYF